MQPIVVDDRGVIRFKANEIILHLFEAGIVSLNKIRTQDFPVEDVEQFWQMLGYSVSGYGDLSFVREKTIETADKKAEKLRIKHEKRRQNK